MIQDEKKRIKARDKYRHTVCAGCRHNYYNYPSGEDSMNAGSDGNGCWNLDSVNRERCPFHTGKR
jgi:hypothetical protein